MGDEDDESGSIKSENLLAYGDDDFSHLNQSNISMVISKMICVKMGGDLKQDIASQRATPDKKIFFAYMVADLEQ